MKTKLICLASIIFVIAFLYFRGPVSVTLTDAAFNGDIKRVQSLLDDGADVNVKDTVDGATPLWMATWKGHTDIVKTLLQSNADVNAKDTDGNTPLNIAQQQGHTQIITLLKEHGTKE